MTIQNWDKRLGVYLVMDIGDVNGQSALAIAQAAIAGGVDVIQLREKKAPLHDVIETGRKLCKLCRDHGVLFIVNDRVDVALLLEADGVHVGQDDLPADEARRLVGTDMFIGVSASSMEEAQRALEQGADYLGVGAIYATNSKSDAGDPVTPQLIADIRAITSVPLVGIGGITVDNCTDVMEHGADGVAVISAIVGAPDPKAAAALLKRRIAAYI
ncbi:thiamine-phosphate diphosphorylase [Aneurinibacillus soli]|uniref:Thiamine-phosphate synthase n=1 Tax=Aneurinibacillus soli TaxID=1500254 RepID=A0A0U5AW58_9BACL|nr:thiamine phosphate synthase [Aneurinibacillus soli]PYE64029.1 thiamine-phosphate diphosphorylase [Aneurinibacillus soli]BAU27978.1 Thiamine-phosphate synthase [Aneurinibacillus soli]